MGVRSEFSKLFLRAKDSGVLAPEPTWDDVPCLQGLTDRAEIDRRRSLLAEAMLAASLAACDRIAGPRPSGYQWRGPSLGDRPDVIAAASRAFAAMDRAIVAGDEAVAALRLLSAWEDVQREADGFDAGPFDSPEQEAQIVRMGGLIAGGMSPPAAAAQALRESASGAPDA